MGEVMTGNNDISVTVIGAVFYLSSNWQLLFGAQSSIRKQIMTMELSLRPQSYKAEILVLGSVDN
jgi:hypothetical protein